MKRLTEGQLAKIAQAHERARTEFFKTLEALEPIARGTPGLPEQLDRIRQTADRFETATETFIKRLERTQIGD